MPEPLALRLPLESWNLHPRRQRAEWDGSVEHSWIYCAAREDAEKLSHNWLKRRADLSWKKHYANSLRGLSLIEWT